MYLMSPRNAIIYLFSFRVSLYQMRKRMLQIIEKDDFPKSPFDPPLIRGAGSPLIKGGWGRSNVKACTNHSE